MSRESSSKKQNLLTVKNNLGSRPAQGQNKVIGPVDIVKKFQITEEILKRN